MNTNEINARNASVNDTTEPRKVCLNRPSESKLKQQKLDAWQPILTAGTVLPVFFVIGVVFIPIGAVLLIASNDVYEYVYDYTDCIDSKRGMLCNSTTLLTPCRCQHSFTVEKDITGPLFIYYGLTNFYQNHRRYVKSRDDRQLLGDVKSASADCVPFRYADESYKTPILPCGATANSFFNDSFYMTVQPISSNGTSSRSFHVPFNFTNIAWPSDKASKFRNPADGDFSGTSKPFNWPKPITEIKNKLQNESFIVWMRISALPYFRKLYARIDQTDEFVKGLMAGNYTVNIVYNYPTSVFEGRKRFIVSTTSWAGGKNPFLGIAYIVVGCLCVLTGVIFFFIHIKYGKSLTELASVHR